MSRSDTNQPVRNERRTKKNLLVEFSRRLPKLRFCLMDRYMLVNFLLPFFYCMFGFIGIWLVYDFGQNGLNLLNDMKVPFAAVAGYYLRLLPAIVTITLPVALLLAFLYTLMRMSRRNELLSFLTAGVSLPRVLLPLFTVSAVVVLISFLLNYELSPTAERVTKEQVREFQGRERDVHHIFGVVYRNRVDGRLWYAQRMQLRNEREFRGLQVMELRDDGSVHTKYFAHRAVYLPTEKTWQLFGTKRVTYDESGTLMVDDDKSVLMIRGWSETPQQIASSNLRAATMSVGELEEYLYHNAGSPARQLAPYRTHLHHRWAAPLICFAVALISAPLAVVFNRRGMLASVTAAVVLFFALWFGSQLFLALGEGDRFAPFLAAWLPVISFCVLGAFLLWLRTTNREVSIMALTRPAFWKDVFTANTRTR